MDALVQVTIPYYTNIPEDVSVNTWSFSNDVGSIDVAQVGAFMQTLYTAFLAYASPILDFTRVQGKFYDRADPEPRDPFFEAEFDLGDDNLANDSLPYEVAMCLSFHAQYASGSPKARRRGRVYLGPLGANTGAAGSLDEACMTDILDAYVAAWTELTDAGLVHSVWSPTDGVARTVTTAWMDNAYDTQRRRGVRANVRDVRTGPF